MGREQHTEVQQAKQICLHSKKIPVKNPNETSSFLLLSLPIKIRLKLWKKTKNFLQKSVTSTPALNFLFQYTGGLYAACGSREANMYGVSGHCNGMGKLYDRLQVGSWRATAQTCRYSNYLPLALVSQGFNFLQIDAKTTNLQTCRHLYCSHIH